MSIVVTDIGKNANNSGASVVLSSVTVPAGALIVVYTGEDSSATSGGSVSDGVNTYTSIASNALNNNGGNGFGTIWYAWNVTALSSGSITYTKHTSGATACLGAFQATGILNSGSPLDGAVTNSATGASATITSGTPAVAGELIVGVVVYNGISSTPTFTQDSTHGAFAAPPDLENSFITSEFAGGYIVQTGSAAAQTYTPTLSLNPPSFIAIVGFKPTPAVPPIPPPPMRIVRRRVN